MTGNSSERLTFCLLDVFPHFLLIFMIIIDFPSLISAAKTTAFSQRPPGFGISEVLLSFSRRDCEDEEQTSSQLLRRFKQKHTCFFSLMPLRSSET